MASQKIDELQIQIGSDASDAIRQLGNLATALNIASAAASKLGGMSGALKSFSHGIENLTRADLSGAIDNLTKLSRINLSNLKDKKVNIDISVSGADRMDRLRYAAAQAERDLSKSFAAMGKTLGKDMGMDTSGIKNVQTILRDMAHDVAGNGNAAVGVERLKEAISETAKVSTADLTGMRREYESFLKDVETLRINPGQISKDEMAEWKKMGLERLLQRGGQRIDTDVFGFDSAFLAEHSNIIDAFSVPMDAPDQFVFLREKILEAKTALDGFVQTDAVTEKIDQIAETYREKIQSMMEATTSERMVGSADKIPIDLNIDQSRFESQIQKAINAATDKTYDTKPIKLRIDGQQLRQNVEAAFSLVDLPQLPKMAGGFAMITKSISSLNQTNLKDTGINSFVHALRKLGATDMSKFDVSILDKMSKAITEISNTSGVDKTITRFVSALSKLAAVGDSTQKTADGLLPLAKALRTTIKMMTLLGNINETVTRFVYGLAQLAAAGDNTQKTADNLQSLTTAVVNFVKELSQAPDISTNVATAIQGLGMLAESGENVQKALNGIGRSGGSNATADVLKNSIFSSARMFAHDFAALNVQVLKLSGHGVKALAGFMQQLHLLPGGAANVDRTALSFMNLLRAIVPFYGIRGIFDWAKQSFEAGSSIVELQNVINTAFGSVINGYRDISGYIYNWSKGTIDAFGVSEIAAQKYAGRLMSMFNSSGFDATEGMRDSAAKMTTDLIERAGDIASFYDIGVDEAMTKMQAALAGMSRPMRSLGVNMNIANLEAFALSQGIHQSWQEMDQATQMAVRYAYMLDATKYAEGDFGRTSMSAANQVRILQLNVQQLSATMGQGLVSAIAPVLAWLNALVKRLIQAAVAFRTFMWTLFGKPLAAVRGLVNDTAGYLDDAAGAASSLGDAGGGAADGLGSAGKAAKDLKKQLTLLPFDQLNQLAKDTDSAGSGGSGGGGGGGGGVGGLGDLSDLGIMPDYDDMFADSPVINAINRWATRIREAFQKHQWANLGRIVAEGINAGFQYIYDALAWEKIKPIVVDGFIKPFQTTINSMADWIDWDLIGRTFGRGLNTVVYTLVAWINGFHWRDFGKHLAEGLNGMIDEWNAMEFGHLLGSKLRAAWDFFGGLVSNFNYKNLGTKLEELVRTAIITLNPKDMGESIATFLNGLSETAVSMLNDGKVKEDITSALVEFLNGFSEDFDEEKASHALKLIADTIIGGITDALRTADTGELVTQLGVVLSSLPWGTIAGLCAAKAGANLALAIFGGIVFKNIAKNLISSAITEATGGAALGGVGAGAGGAGAAGVGASGGGSLFAGLSTLTVGTIAVGGSIMLGALSLGVLLNKWTKSHGGVEQFQGKNLAPSYQQPKQQAPVSGQNSAGYNTQIQQSPQFTPSQAASKTISMPDIITKVKTILFGEKDQSFSNLELAKSSLMDTPVVKKIMNGELTPFFKDAYGQFTDTKAYDVIKSFFGKDKNGFVDKYSKYIYNKAHNVTKVFTGGDKSGFVDKFTKYVYTKAHNVTKWFNGGNGNGFLDKFSKYTYTRSHNVTKWFNGESGGGFLDKFSKYIYTKSHNVTKWFTGKDGGNFMSYFNKFAYSLYDKTVKVTFDIITTAKNVVASIVGKGREILASIWTENARGGLFTGPTGFQVFGEAGAEAAIPLERKSTMKRIGNAIVNAGGMGTSNSEDIANAVAEKIAPIIMSAMSGQENRPINVNATLYTENNEVLARAVNQGNRSLDKRYNPVTQYSY